MANKATIEIALVGENGVIQGVKRVEKETVKLEKSTKKTERAYKDLGNNATKDLKKTEKASKELEKQNKKTSDSFKALAGGAIVGLGGANVVSAFLKQESAARNLHFQLGKLPHAYGETTKSLQEWVSQLQRVGAVGDEALLPVLSNLMRIGSQMEVPIEQVKEYTRLTADLHAATGRDVEQLGRQMGRLMQGNAGVLSSFSFISRIRLTELNQYLRDTGDLVGYNNQILKIMRENVGGLNEDARTATFGGAFKALQGSLGDIQEVLGGELLETFLYSADAVSDLAGFLQDANEEITDVLVIGTKIGALFAITLKAGVISYVANLGKAKALLAGMLVHSKGILSTTISIARASKALPLGAVLLFWEDILDYVNWVHDGLKYHYDIYRDIADTLSEILGLNKEINKEEKQSELNSLVKQRKLLADKLAKVTSPGFEANPFDYESNPAFITNELGKIDTQISALRTEISSTGRHNTTRTEIDTTNPNILHDLEVNQMRIDIMKEGLEKERAQINQNYQERLVELNADLNNEVIDQAKFDEKKELLDRQLKKELLDAEKKFSEKYSESTKKSLEERNKKREELEKAFGGSLINSIKNVKEREKAIQTQSHIERLALLNEAREEGILSETRYREMLEVAQNEHNSKMLEIDEKHKAELLESEKMFMQERREEMESYIDDLTDLDLMGRQDRADREEAAKLQLGRDAEDKRLKGRPQALANVHLDRDLAEINRRRNLDESQSDFLTESEAELALNEAWKKYDETMENIAKSTMKTTDELVGFLDKWIDFEKLGPFGGLAKKFLSEGLNESIFMGGRRERNQDKRKMDPTGILSKGIENLGEESENTENHFSTLTKKMMGTGEIVPVANDMSDSFHSATVEGRQLPGTISGIFGSLKQGIAGLAGAGGGIFGSIGGLIGGSTGSAIGGIFDSLPIFHDGGQVEDSTGGHVFGLSNDERLAILEVGETVLPKNTNNNNQNNTNRTEVNVYNYASNTEVEQEQDITGQVTNIIIRDLSNRGRIGRAIENSYGARRPPR